MDRIIEEYIDKIKDIDNVNEYLFQICFSVS